MGENGTLQDSSGNEVQGWAMLPVSDDDIVSSDENTKVFTEQYETLISSRIIRYSNNIETISTKTTDYASTAQADALSVYSGFGRKSQADKRSDVEALIKDYNEKLQELQEDPNAPSAISVTQRTAIDFPDEGDATAINGDSDQVTITIDGDKYTVEWDSDYVTTMKSFADEISSISGLKAYVVDAAFQPSSEDADIQEGRILIESMIPGEEFSITQRAMVNNSTITEGSIITTESRDAVQGTGRGALESSLEALKAAVVGKQRDVYTTTELDFGGTGLASNEYTYQINIYDEERGINVDVPVAPLTIGPLTTTTASEQIDEIVAAINADTGTGNSLNLANYVEALNINGNLVIRTINKHEDAEFRGDLKLSSNSGTALTTFQDILVEPNLTGREGAGAELLQITSRIDQLATPDSIQLRLDTLELTDSAFGSFSADSSGLVTMNQDGLEFAIGQVAIAHFTHERGLDPLGNNLLVKTIESGEPIYNINNEKNCNN